MTASIKKMKENTVAGNCAGSTESERDEISPLRGALRAFTFARTFPELSSLPWPILQQQQDCWKQERFVLLLLWRIRGQGNHGVDQELSQHAWIACDGFLIHFLYSQLIRTAQPTVPWTFTVWASPYKKRVKKYRGNSFDWPHNVGFLSLWEPTYRPVSLLSFFSNIVGGQLYIFIYGPLTQCGEKVKD